MLIAQTFADYVTVHLSSVKVKVKFTLEHATKAHRERERADVVALLFLQPRRLVWVGRQRHAPAALPPRKTRYHCIGDWVGPRAGLDGCGKFSHPPGFDPRTVQTVASRYTD